MSETALIEILLNGEPYRIASESTLADLVRELKLAPERLAVEHNLTIAARAAWSTTQLRAGDRLEIVHFVGGG